MTDFDDNEADFRYEGGQESKKSAADQLFLRVDNFVKYIRTVKNIFSLDR